MTVRVVLPGALREYADGLAELSVDLPGSGTVGDVLDEALGTRSRLRSRVRDETGAIRRHVNVFVDGQECRTSGGLAHPVQPTSVVHIIQSVSGG
ncbi:MAG TPA: MoaD/ThiS family protein [Dermatophilaceae bacterium]|nr:MoaD/ThiS family protein [Dermatophilaceae bacterium]